MYLAPCTVLGSTAPAVAANSGGSLRHHRRRFAAINPALNSADGHDSPLVTLISIRARNIGGSFHAGSEKHAPSKYHAYLLSLESLVPTTSSISWLSDVAVFTVMS